jgi:hypothetical protein
LPYWLPLAPRGRLREAHIVFIYADDWGWGDLSCHGHPWLKTPNLDRLAAEGTDFKQFNVLNPRVLAKPRGGECHGTFGLNRLPHRQFRNALRPDLRSRRKRRCREETRICRNRFEDENAA